MGAASAAAIASIISMLGGFNGGLTSAHPVVALPEGRSVTLDDAFAGREGSRPDGGSIEDRSALEECHRSRQAYSAVLAVDPPRTADFRACFGADVGQESLSGIEFVRRVADSGTSGADVELTDVAITGDVDLRPIRNVERPIRCTRCVFQGHVLARDVRFGGIMEFIDARFERRVDLRGAFFDQAAIFDGSEFLESIELSSARFGALSSFAEVRFADTALFDRTVFAGRAVFASSDPVVDRPNERCGSEQPAFVMRASFVGASFGDAADFRQRCFEQSAIFQSASFAAAADFTLTTFFGTASFDQVGLAEGGEFVVADFQRDLSFAGTATAGVLDFAGSTIRARSDFTGLGGSGALRLEGIKTPSNDVFVMNDVTVTSLAMDPDRVAQVGGPAVRVEILELIVATAQTEGRLGLANDAQFELMSIRGTNKR